VRRTTPHWPLTAGGAFLIAHTKTMRIDLTSNVREVIPAIDALFSDQVPYAIALALTKTARLVADGLPADLTQDLDRPTEFTKRGFYVQAARKDFLQATVGVKDKQAAYLGYQIEGGERRPMKKALRLPANVQLNDYGNVPSGLIRQLIARAKAGRRVTKGQARRFGVSQELDLFYGEPPDGRPAGIYKRVTISPTRHQLVPIIVFPARPATYRAHFDFAARAARIADREFGAAFTAAWQQAVATAR